MTKQNETEGITIRKCLSSDHDELAQQISKMISGKNANDQASALATRFLNSNGISACVLQKDSEIIGFYVLKMDPYEGGNGLAEITFLHIDDKYRGKGFGRDLLSHAIEAAEEAKIRKIYVLTNPKNVHAACFWLRNNFEFEVRMTDFSSAGSDDYYLSRTI